MIFEFTKHASEVISERGIPVEFVERVISGPELTLQDAGDPDLIHYLSKIGEHDGRVLRVIVNIKSSPVRVVTAYFDRSMRGRL